MIEATSYDNISTNISAACVRLGQIRFVLIKLKNFCLKLGRLDEQVIDAGREFRILGPWQRIALCEMAKKLRLWDTESHSRNET